MNKKLNDFLKKINTIIINEILIVFDKLFNFILNIFIILKNNTITFKGINIIVISNLT